MTIVLSNGEDQMYSLTGLIYADGHHFVCRLIDKQGCVWYHDGMAGTNCVYQGQVKSGYDTTWLKKSNQKILTYAIYCR